MDYETAKRQAQMLTDATAAAAKAMHGFPSGPMGITPDSVKASPEFKAAKKAYDSAFAEMRDFNAYFVKTFNREYAADRLARRGKA